MGVARCGLSLTPPVMCEHVRGWHQATPMFSSPWSMEPAFRLGRLNALMKGFVSTGDRAQGGFTSPASELGRRGPGLAADLSC